MSKYFRFITLHWAHGCAAYHDGRSLSDCPHHRDGERRREWVAGWTFAYERNRQTRQLHRGKKTATIK